MGLTFSFEGPEDSTSFVVVLDPLAVTPEEQVRYHAAFADIWPKLTAHYLQSLQQGRTVVLEAPRASQRMPN
jgi:hypothetical protein